MLAYPPAAGFQRVANQQISASQCVLTNNCDCPACKSMSVGMTCLSAFTAGCLWAGAGLNAGELHVQDAAVSNTQDPCRRRSIGVLHRA